MTPTARLAAAFLASALLLLAPVPALAQLSPSAGRGGSAAGAGTDKDQPAKEVPPPALPGAEPATEGVIPTDKGTADLPPTEALFDAIHRGDVASARDALNRGADLDGHNVLGQSPLDLSIDLNRNDITFLLLSMRGPGGGERGPRASEAQGAAPDSAPPAHGRRVREARDRAPRADEPAAPGATSEPRPVLFARDGGVPKPSVGFLGFSLR